MLEEVGRSSEPVPISTGELSSMSEPISQNVRVVSRLVHTSREDQRSLTLVRDG